jgi:uncharacterized protein (UPF0333 family)
MFYVRTKGQSTLEYVILLGFVVAALIAMGVYMKRASEGKLRESTDQVGEQYDPFNTSSNYTTVSNMSQSETSYSDGSSIVTINAGDNTQNKTGSEKVEAWTNASAPQQ